MAVNYGYKPMMQSQRNNQPRPTQNNTWQERLKMYSTDKQLAQQEIQRAKSVYEQEKANGADQSRLDQIHRWANQVRDASGISFDDPTYGSNVKTYNPNFQNNQPVNNNLNNQQQMSIQTNRPDYLNNVSEYAQQVNLNFNDWDNYDEVMNQLSYSANAIGQLASDFNITRNDISDLYEHYLKSHARATELGYAGTTAPAIVSGYTDPNDRRWENFVSPEDRGFQTNTPVQERYSKYLGKLGTEEGRKIGYLQNAISSLRELEQLQDERGIARFDWNKYYQLHNTLNTLRDEGITDMTAGDAWDNGAGEVIASILQNTPIPPERLGMSEEIYESYVKHLSNPN